MNNAIINIVIVKYKQNTIYVTCKLQLLLSMNYPQLEENIDINVDINININDPTNENSFSSWLNWTKQRVRELKSNVYNVTIGYFYTVDVMRKLLITIPNNSTILDIGIGSGYTYSKNNNIIKRKNLTITGIDIDDEYIRSAKHSVIDSKLESHVKLILGDIYKISEDDIPTKYFDYVFFSDNYAVIPNVHDVITFSEKFLKPTGHMIITSTLFDNFDDKIDWIKQRLVYISSVEFGKMMLREELEAYIRTRCSKNINECFKIINNKQIPGSNYRFKTYIVKWQPDSITLRSSPMNNECANIHE